MKCERARNLIHAELDGEIKAEQQRTLQSHVETCESCGLMRAQWRAMERGFDWLAEQSGTLAQAPATASTIIRPSWLWRAAGAAVAAAAVIALLVAWPFGGPSEHTRLVTSDEPTTNQPGGARFEFELVGESFEKYLAVEQESGEPNVHIVWPHKNQGYSKESSRVDDPETTLHL